MSQPPQSLFFNPWLFCLVISSLSLGCLHAGLELYCQRLEHSPALCPFTATAWLLPPSPRALPQLFSYIDGLKPQCHRWACAWPPYIQLPFSLLQKPPLSSSLGWSECLHPHPDSCVLRADPRILLLPLHTRTRDRRGWV